MQSSETELQAACQTHSQLEALTLFFLNLTASISVDDLKREENQTKSIPL
jgi:hypothetical protein